MGRKGLGWGLGKLVWVGGGGGVGNVGRQGGS